MGRYILDFQVWRPSPTVDSTGTGCYSLVGNNRFTSISLSSGLAIVTPSSQDYIQFQHGDVLGIYVDEHRKAEDGKNDGVVVLTSPSSFTSELVWYASIAPTMTTSQNGGCPLGYSVGSNGILDTSTRAAPVISISTGILAATQNQIIIIRPLIFSFSCSHISLPFTTLSGYITAYPYPWEW